jgi:hypothetical protein
MKYVHNLHFHIKLCLPSSYTDLLNIAGNEEDYRGFHDEITDILEERFDHLMHYKTKNNK